MLLSILLAVASCSAVWGQSIVSFEGDSPIETDQGFAQLNWAMEEEPRSETSPEFELQQSRSESFAEARTIYRGPDRASFVSGLPEGGTWFRVRMLSADETIPTWSAPMEVVVAYPEADFVVTWLVIGSIVFVIAVAAVVAGHVNTKDREIV
ncbi:MAG: hypothetical protein AAGK14_11065 [Verrucomicrobiota bacterium]